MDYLFSLNLGPRLMLYESSDCLSNDVLIMIGVIVADLAVGFSMYPGLCMHELRPD